MPTTPRKPMGQMRRLKECAFDGCTDAVVARGWCDLHYRRWKRHGDPAAFLRSTAFGEPWKFYIEKVLTYDGDECLIWPFNRNSGGYGMLFLEGHHRFVHRLACGHVHGAPPTPKHQAAHSCGKGKHGCATLRHLSWKTARENHADKIAHGTSNRGEANYAAKLTASDVRSIRSIAGSMSQAKIGRLFGIQQTTVGEIIRRKAWSWLDA